MAVSMTDQSSCSQSNVPLVNYLDATCRRLARKKREAELVAFSATRPDDSFESPADLQAIRQAEQNMGDFKLKSDPEYIPPEVPVSQLLCNISVGLYAASSVLW